MSYRLSPHDLAHFNDEWCHRCWWLAKRHQLKPPGSPFPEVTRVADDQMKKAFSGMRLDWLGIPGTARGAKKTWLLSKAIEIAGAPVEIGGYADEFVDLDDGTVGIIDYKMTTPKAWTAQRYEPQLNAYAYAMENPAEAAPVKVGGLWLVCWTPGQLMLSPDEMHPQPFMGSIKALPVLRKAGSTERLMDLHAQLLIGPLPSPSTECKLCGYMSLAAAKVKEIKAQILKAEAA